jgi:hypothetical protein
LIFYQQTLYIEAFHLSNSEIMLCQTDFLLQNIHSAAWTIQLIYGQGSGLTGQVIGVRSPAGAKYFLFSATHRPALGPNQPPIQMLPRAPHAEVKWQGHAADHSPWPGAEIKHTWSYSSTHPYSFMAWCLITSRDKFTFTFYLHVSYRYSKDLVHSLCVLRFQRFTSRLSKYATTYFIWEIVQIPTPS